MTESCRRRPPSGRAGPAGAPPAKDAAEAPRELGALLAWFEESNNLLLRTLREAGPDRECWTWWSAGVSPANARGVARRRVHEVPVHTYDAQLAAGLRKADAGVPRDRRRGRVPRHLQLHPGGLGP
ncbi:maleylpyruvate isomerase N-terminal domain-containing protein [Streptomyces sp. enrichment culture]|uniref:maleylpyruvate isomerase N-terminal domain-containing protein n=1 Tax=Streptomyces sp. enrichment culture TaxID=1795815 RepID=UPI003F57BD1B